MGGVGSPITLRLLAPVWLNTSQSPTLSSGRRQDSSTWSRPSSELPHRLLEYSGSSAETFYSKTANNTPPFSLLVQKGWVKQEPRWRWFGLVQFSTEHFRHVIKYGCSLTCDRTIKYGNPGNDYWDGLGIVYKWVILKWKDQRSPRKGSNATPSKIDCGLRDRKRHTLSPLWNHSTLDRQWSNNLQYTEEGR